MALWPSLDVLRVPGSRRRGGPDPFAALRLQVALTRLEREIAAIRADDVSFARAHKLRAATTAYDGVLADACRAAGLPAPDDDRFDAVGRLRAEADLEGLGWSW